jgi:integrase/recombinase XerC
MDMEENALARIEPAGPIGPPALGEVDLLAAFLAGRRPTTLRAYAKDLADFAAFLGLDDARAAVELLVSGSGFRANALALGYRAHLTDRGLAPATIARRLAALRSFVKLARTLGRVAWTIDVPSPRSEAYRDTRGPDRDGWRKILDTARGRATTPRGRRNLALIRLMHDHGLRRGEVAALDLADVDLEAGTVAVVGKGKSERTNLTLNRSAVAELARWIEDRGGVPGPLFVRLDRPGPPTRLDPSNIAKASKTLGRRAGAARGSNPHGLRHHGITRLLEINGGDVRKAQKFSRHAKVETVLRYDDNRKDEFGAGARMLDEDPDR